MAILTRVPRIPLLVLALVCGCERAPTPVELRESTLGVFSVLRAGSDTVSVLILRFPPDLDPFARTEEPVSGAEVRISADGVSVPLREQRGGVSSCESAGAAGPAPVAGCYSAVLPGPVRSGSRYTLDVVLPDGGTVRGETEIPYPSTILAPARDQSVTPQPSGPGFLLPVVWETPAGAGAVVLTLRPEPASCTVVYEREDVGGNAIIRVGGAGPARDSTVVRIARVACTPGTAPSAQEPVPARLILATLDTAQARYNEQLDAEPTALLRRRASAGLEGAIGVFGGQAVTERRVLFPRSR